MLNLHALRQQIKDFGSYQLQYQQESEASLHIALDAFQKLARQGSVWTVPSSEKNHTKLIAVPVEEEPFLLQHASERPTPVTVVATDGSQIYPDRHIEPLWYLINVSRIVFHYGTLETPLLDSVPKLYFRGQALDDLDEELIEVTGRDIVSALRDEQELQELFQIAYRARVGSRPLLAMADGTLIRWMLRRMQNPNLEANLLKRYTRVLSAFREEKIPLCSYISMPANKEFVRLLMHQVTPDIDERERRIKDINDRLFFERILPSGSRTAIFKSQSRILSSYADDLQVCYFYVHVSAGESMGEIARVEFPTWLAQDDSSVQLIHATVISESEKGRGYPMILSEAHEHAVVRGPERRLFYEMIEREAAGQGRVLSGSLKRRAKMVGIG